MDQKRAKEIADSPLMADVTCNGEPIYIEKVNSDTANVHSLHEPGQKKEVPLNSLIEH